MKIAQVCFYYAPVIGGVERVVEEFAQGLKILGNECQIFTSQFDPANSNRKLPKVSSENGITVHRGRGLSLLLKLLQFRPHIIHVHSFPSRHFWVASLASKILRVPLVLTGHFHPDHFSQFLNSENPYLRREMIIARFLLKFIDGYTSVTYLEENAIRKFQPNMKALFKVIPNGVTLNKLQFQPQKPNHIFTILFVGRLTKIKGIHILIEAFGLLQKKYSEKKIILNVIGPETNEDEYLKTLHQISIENIHFLGAKSQNESIEHMSRSHVLVLPSFGDSFGIVLIEAMAVGTFVVGSNNGGIPAVFKNESEGFLFETGNPNDLCSRLEELLLMDETAKNNYLIKARKRVEDDYDWNVIVANLENFYKDLLQ